MSVPAQHRIGVVCSACGRGLGAVTNMGPPGRLAIRVPCPCGGASEVLPLADVYDVEHEGSLPEGWLQAQILRAVEAAQRARAAELSDPLR